MRAAALTSLAAHLFVLLVLFAVRTGSPQIVPGPDVIQVALIEPRAVSPPPVREVKPEPETRRPEVKPTDESGIRIAPPPRKRKAVEAPKAKEPEPFAGAAVLPYAPVGPPGLRGQVSAESVDFEFTYYLLLVRNRVAQNWSPPTGLVGGGPQVRAVVYFRIARDGEVSGIRMQDASGVEFFDRSALRAVTLSAPMPPLPLGFAGAELGVHFGFEYAAP